MDKTEVVKDYIIKSNVLINVMANLSLQENRLLGYIISLLDRNIQPEEDRLVEIEIPVLGFAEQFLLDRKCIYNEIEELADALQKKILKLDPDDCIDNRRRKIGVILEQSYLDGEGRVFIKLSPHIVPHLLGLKERFTGYRIKDVYQFTSKHSWRLYELLIQYKKIGRRKFKVEELKRKTVGYNIYPRWGDLKRRVVDNAVREINNVSDIMVQYSVYKRGKKISELEFFIQEKEKNNKDNKSQPPINIKPNNKQKSTSNLDIYSNKNINEMSNEEQKEAIYRALKRVGVHDGPAKQIQEAIINEKFDYKIKLIQKLDILEGRYKNLKNTKTTLAGYITSSLYKELQIESKQSKKQNEEKKSDKELIRLALEGLIDNKAKDFDLENNIDDMQTMKGLWNHLNQDIRNMIYKKACARLQKEGVKRESQNYGMIIDKCYKLLSEGLKSLIMI